MHHFGSGRLEDRPTSGQRMYPTSSRQEVPIVVATERVRALFAGARVLQADALVLARTGEEPERTPAGIRRFKSQ